MATLLTLRLYDAAGDLADADETVTLSDSTGSWGIRRVRDNAIVVIAGATVAHPSTGVYTYDFSALNLDPQEAYVYSFQYGAESFQAGSIAAQGGTTLRRARRALAERLAGARQGAYALIVAGVQEEPPSGIYAGTAGGTLFSTTADAQRRIVSTDLAAQAEGGGEGLPHDLWDNAYAYVLSTVPEQRALAPGGYISDAEAAVVTDQNDSEERVGYLTLSRRLGAVVAPGTEVEVHTRLPVLRADGKVGLHWCLNEALQSMRTARRLSVDAVSSQYRYEYDDDWLTQGGQIVGALDTEWASGMEPYPVLGGEAVRRDGAVTYVQLDTTYTTGQTFYLETERPAKTWIKSGGTWADSNVGLVDEADEAAVPLRWLTLVAYYYACDALSRTDPRGEHTYWASERDRAIRAALPYLMSGPNNPVQRSDRFRRGSYPRISTSGYDGDVLRRSGRGWP